MAMPNSRPSTPHSSLHRPQQTRTPCPKNHASVYDRLGRGTPVQLDVARLIKRLGRLDTRPSSAIVQNASRLAAPLSLDPYELLHRAIDRALRPKASRPNIRLVPYLTMLMRSIASSIHRARARASERGRTLPLNCVAEQVPSTRGIVDPATTIIPRDERAYYERLLGQVTGGDPMLEQLVDQIGFGHRGDMIVQQMGIDPLQLATLRRRLKRRAYAVVQESRLMPVDKGGMHFA